MICKEDFCAIFKDLHSAERIDLMCGLLQLCVPLELRFLGSHLEELARKDCAYLRKYEIISNDLSSLKDASDNDSVDTTDSNWICALNVYLSLLHSDNTTCAHVLFGILSRLEHAVEVRVMSKSTAGSVPQQDSRLPDIGSSTDLMLDLVLLFTMAVHHPAFTYSQRQQLYTSCKKIEKLLNYIPSYKVWAQLFIARSWYLSGRDVKRSSNIRTSKKIFEFEFVFDPSKFDFQIPTGLNSAKSVLWLH